MDTYIETPNLRPHMLKRLHEMSKTDRVVLGRQIEFLQQLLGVGPTGAMELLYKLGTWLNEHDCA